MSDTPISDSTPHNVAELGMLCRRLERQLTAANVEIEEKRKDIVWLATEKAKSENYVTELENRLRALWDKYDGDRKHYIDRIKRLEEALGLVLKMRNDWLENQEDGYEGAYYAFVKGNDSEWEEIIKAKEDKL